MYWNMLLLRQSRCHILVFYHRAIYRYDTTASGSTRCICRGRRYILKIEVLPWMCVRGSTRDCCREWTTHAGTYCSCRRVPGRCVVLVLCYWAIHRYMFKMTAVYVRDSTRTAELLLLIVLQIRCHTVVLYYWAIYRYDILVEARGTQDGSGTWCVCQRQYW